MLRAVRLALAVLFAAAFLLGAWGSFTPSSADPMGCDARMHDMGQMSGKSMPKANDCMTKAGCTVACVRLPNQLQISAASAYGAYSFPASLAAAFETNYLSPDPSPPKLFA